MLNLNSKLFYSKCNEKRSNISTFEKSITNDLPTVPYNPTEDHHHQNNVFKNSLINFQKKHKTMFFKKPFHLIQSETIDTRYNYFHNLTNEKLNFKLNLSSTQLFQLKQFISKKPFSIIQCDKNIGMSILSHNLHNKLCLSHLEDENTYLKLPKNPIKNTMNKIESTLKYLHSNGHLKIGINKHAWAL